MSDPSKQERIGEFLRKSLLGEELVNTQFHLFSARSSQSGRAFKPRVLCANNVLLAKSSKYFLDLLSSDINPSDPSLIDVTDDNDVPNNVRTNDYGYGSDSDLDDCDDSILVVSKNQVAIPSNSTSKTSTETQGQVKDIDESSDDDSESIGSDMFVMSPEHPKVDELLFGSKDGARSVASSETAVHNNPDKKSVENGAAIRLRSLGSRHVLVKDTAFRTWYTLLNYLYCDKFNFSPLGSTMLNGQSTESSTNFLDEPRCSAKSMYRLACKVGLDRLRDEAFSYIRSNLTEHNILQELSCSLLSRYPQLLEMELDVLYSHIASPQVVANFPAFAQRIANKDFSHGAEIIVGIHTRLLKEPHPLPWKPADFTPLSGDSKPSHPMTQTPVSSSLPASENNNDARSSPMNKEIPLSAPTLCLPQSSILPELSASGGVLPTPTTFSRHPKGGEVTGNTMRNAPLSKEPPVVTAFSYGQPKQSYQDSPKLDFTAETYYVAAERRAKNSGNFSSKPRGDDRTGR